MAASQRGDRVLLLPAGVRLGEEHCADAMVRAAGGERSGAELTENSAKPILLLRGHAALIAVAHFVELLISHPAADPSVYMRPTLTAYIPQDSGSFAVLRSVLRSDQCDVHFFQGFLIGISGGSESRILGGSATVSWPWNAS